MPTLPTLTITDQTSWNRILAAFGDAATYKAWLRGAVRDYVQSKETVALRDSLDAQVAAKQAELTNLMDSAT